MYSLTLAEDGHILSATFPQYNPSGVIVETLPEGDITDYIYKEKAMVIKDKSDSEIMGEELPYEYIYSPISKPEPPAPTKTTDERLKELEQRQWDTEAALIELASISEGGVPNG